ncbi:Coiled-coil protein [Giardia muris]|uniref:Coiled-coil protein n=1 Tax=Giardia muris TaxID=5742 RepID=A0A4Z1SPN8_GIAMU|nr:Coiled-coil protein [Giardia muris]|eukprot:TNJ26835.1 Coiled-coil protein [Giardia muris]
MQGPVVLPTPQDAAALYRSNIDNLKREYDQRLGELFNRVCFLSLDSGEPHLEQGGISEGSRLTLTGEMVRIFQASLYSEKETKIRDLLEELARTRSLVEVSDQKLVDTAGNCARLDATCSKLKQEVQGAEQRIRQLEKKLTEAEHATDSLAELKSRYAALEHKSRLKYEEYKSQLAMLKNAHQKLESENQLLKHDQGGMHQCRNELNDLKLKYNTIVAEHNKLQADHRMALFELKSKDKALAAVRASSAAQSSKEKTQADGLAATVDKELKDQRRVLTLLSEQLQRQNDEISLLRLEGPVSTNTVRPSIGAPGGSGQIPLSQHYETVKLECDLMRQQVTLESRVILMNAQEEFQQRLLAARQEFLDKETEIRNAMREEAAQRVTKINDELVRVRDENMSLKASIGMKDIELERLATALTNAGAEADHFRRINAELSQNLEAYQGTIAHYEKDSTRRIPLGAFVRVCAEALSDLKGKVKGLQELVLSSIRSPAFQSGLQLSRGLLNTTGVDLLYGGTQQSTELGDPFLVLLQNTASEIGRFIAEAMARQREAVRAEERALFEREKQCLADQFAVQLASVERENSQLRLIITTLRDRMKIEVVKMVGTELTQLRDQCNAQLENIHFEANALLSLLDRWSRDRPRNLAEARALKEVSFAPPSARIDSATRDEVNRVLSLVETRQRAEVPGSSVIMTPGALQFTPGIKK